MLSSLAYHSPHLFNMCQLLFEPCKYNMFHHPFSMIIAGPSKSGKSVFTTQLLNNLHYITMPPDRIIWAYGEENVRQFSDIHKANSSVEFSKGVPVLSDINPAITNLVIIDDLMEDAGKSANIADMFTKGSHHRNLSVILIVQNVFHQGKKMRDISLNASYIVLFKNPRDGRQIRSLANQIVPENPMFMVDAYGKATKHAHGYLLIDLTQQTPDRERFMTGIFDERVLQYYVSTR